MEKKQDELYQEAIKSNSKNFNEFMVQFQKMQEEQQKLNQEEKLTEKLNKLLDQLAKQSQHGKEHFPLLQMILELAPLMDDLNLLKEKIQDSDSDSLALYMKYRSVIKSFEENTEQCNVISKQSLEAATSPEKMKEIKGKLENMLNEMKALHTSVLKKTKRQLFWMDKNSYNNLETLATLQRKYGGNVLVQYYDDDQKFRNDLLANGEHPSVIMMSGVAAGPSIKHGDGDHFNFIKQNKKSLRIMGCVIFCGQRGYDNLNHLMQDESKLLKCITTSEDELLESIDKLFIPKDYKRFILLEHIDFFLPTLRTQLIDIGLKDYSKYSLLKLHPQKKQLEDLFKSAKQLIEQKQIQIFPEVVNNMMNIPSSVMKCFDGSTSEKEIAKNILRLYTQSDKHSPVFEFLNSSLNILNEKLIYLLKEFMYLFIISLYKYDDSSSSSILPDGQPTKLFRGSSIPNDQYNEYIKKDNIIVLPSFSSFTTSEQKAKGFILSNIYDNTTQVLFTYTHFTGKTLYPNRPKSLRDVSVFSHEDEYLIQPFSTFKVQSTQKSPEGYTIINLGMK